MLKAEKIFIKSLSSTVFFFFFFLPAHHPGICVCTNTLSHTHII